jgi:hypothetical protein
VEGDSGKGQFLQILPHRTLVQRIKTHGLKVEAFRPLLKWQAYNAAVEKAQGVIQMFPHDVSFRA